MRIFLTLILCAATSALAIAKGGKLYIKTKDAALMKQPNAKSVAIARLQPGTQVIWNGPSEKDKSWHEVSVDGKKGFVKMQDLSPNQPQSELDTTTGKPMSAEAFASSGASVGCRFGASTSVYKTNSATEAAAAELIYVEELNKAKATPEAILAKHKELHP
ncbi:MAG: hypothetical protein Q8N23_06585 [Archangium sp.]|nr:hypothetical protein [Archangium sp.]MDP3570716.1 hypothetical protein [Archangium sp.]